ncbi:MAG: GNAT family N-acetyltransferase [Oscillibacter sp.]|nr:GNAT family N-acetyltransferase [Oscillibacter sp.]MEA4992870.1 GNAT family N-acetyltransferase [Oscillibacter sp.]
MENTSPDFINLTPESLDAEHLCCIIRSRKPHPGVEAKRLWLSERLEEGHVFRKLNVKGCAFIEYAPLETAWVPIVGGNFLYIYCLWAVAPYKGKGYGRALMEYCIADAKAKGKSGVCMLGAQKQKAWLTDQSFAKSFGFQVVDATDSGYELLALSFDGTAPRFTDRARASKIESRELTIYYDLQCPYVGQSVETVRKYCKEQDVPLTLVPVDTLEQAKNLPCVFNNWVVFYKGTFQTVNLLLDVENLKRILKKE